MGTGAQCRTGGGGRSTPPPSALDARPTDPTAHADWDRLENARSADPGSAATAAVAAEILAKDVPLAVRLAALRAKAEHAYLHQEDAVAIETAEVGLALVDESAGLGAEVVVSLAQIRARALVRGGDPAAALVALDEPLVNGLGGLDPVEAHGLRTVALDRNGDVLAAVRHLVGWRERLTDADPTALWIEQRVALLTESMSAPELAEIVADLPDSPGRACLVAKMGEPVAPAMPPWVGRCASASAGIGMLLPRTGPFAAFADEQLAAALATVEVVAAEGPTPPLLWRDSGGSVASARSAGRSLVAEGSRIVVGPLGAKQVKAVVADLDDRAVIIVPGEGIGRAQGVAPTLERRVESLVALAKEDGRRRLVVLAPDNGYGRRAVRAAEKSAAAGFAEAIVVRTYPAATTSFGPIVNPVMPALRDDSALLVPDTLVRADLVIRQLARAGRLAARGDGPGIMVLTTAEGLEASALAGGRDVLEGVWVAPAAARGVETEAFEAAFARLQGEPPGDQALLVFHALQHAITGRPGPLSGRVTRIRVEGGQLIVQPTQTQG